MKEKRLFHLVVVALAALAAFVLFVPSAIAYVTTDQFDYLPGATVTFSGDNRDDAGYLPDEIVIVDVSGPNGYASSCEAIADLDGAWSCQVMLPTEDAAGTYVYTATGQTSGVSESGVFTDATLGLFEDAGLTIQRNAFAWGETIYALGTEPSTSPSFVGRCFRVQWINPANNVVETDHALGVGSGSPPVPPATITADFTVPPTGPSGVWTAKLQRSTAITDCPNASYSTTGQSIQIFDVARKVIIGAGSPSTGTADNPGGDNFVDQAAAQAAVVQSGGVGDTLKVQPRASLSQRTFLRFDVAGAGIPPIATITDAKLRLRVRKSITSTVCTLPRNYDLQPASASWSEGTIPSVVNGITWNNQPGVVGTASSLNVAGLPADLYLRFGVTDHVQDFVDGSFTNHGWRLKDRDETFAGLNCDTHFFSTESNQADERLWPVLLIDYEPPPPLLTNSSLCTFDVNPDRDGSQFRLIFTPDQLNSTSTDPRWKLNASNPGQFFFNVFVFGTPGNLETITLTLPKPFVTQGANPVRVFDDVTILENDATCLVPGDEIASSADPATVGLSAYTDGTTDIDVDFTFPASGVAYIAVHLDFGWKHYLSKCKPDGKTDPDATCDLPDVGTRIENHTSYEFSYTNVDTDSVTVENENVFKNDPGIAGLVTTAASGNPVAGVRVEIYNSSGRRLATVYTDADGWYQWTYRYTGRPAAFVVKLPAYTLQQTVTLRSNGYLVVNFVVP